MLGRGAAARGTPRIVLDDRPLRRTLTGVGNYIAQLLAHLPHVAPDLQVDPFVFTHLSREGWKPPAPSETGPPPQTSPADVAGGRRPWWMRRAIQAAYGVAFRFKTRGYDLYHEPNHCPVASRLPTVTTIHDLSVLVHPDWHPLDRVKWYESAFNAGLRQARRFIAASEFTRREMTLRLGVDPARIDVTYQGPRAAFQPLTGDALAVARRELAIPERFFLFVGTLEPRKNVEGLIDAFAALPADVRARTPLLIAGAWGWRAENLKEKLASRALVEQVRLLGYLHDPQLAAYYSACTALVWPTLYEGFGLPPLEAMACGAPVIVSDAASLPEVVGDAGVLLPPTDVPAWTEALRRAAKDEAWRAAARARSLDQAARFSWRRCAEETAAIYRRVLAEEV